MSTFIRKAIAGQLKVADVDFATRGFNLDLPESRAWLERSAAAFIEGARLFAGESVEPHHALQQIETGRRGFAYEGAGMTAAMLDLAHLGRTRHLSTLLGGDGFRYRHLIHVGVGWGMAVARVPTPRLWGTLDPLLRWLALDGAGFRSMFFDHHAATAALAVSPSSAGTDDRARIRTQGAGRALWFVHAADIDRIADQVASLPAHLAGDLWSGIGLAAAYAGDPHGVDAARLAAAAGSWRPQLGQGVIFAAAAHHSHGAAPARVATLLTEVVGLIPPEATGWADDTARDLVRTGQTPAGYLEWQRRLQVRVRRSEPDVPTPTATGGHP